MNYIEKARQNRKAALFAINLRRENIFVANNTDTKPEGPRSPLFMELSRRPEPMFDFLQGVA